MDDTAQRRWMAQWRAAAGALEEQRRRELQSLTAEAALAAAEAVLALASPARLAPGRLHDSGLVRQQQLLHRRTAS